MLLHEKDWRRINSHESAFPRALKRRGGRYLLVGRNKYFDCKIFPTLSSKATREKGIILLKKFSAFSGITLQKSDSLNILNLITMNKLSYFYERLELLLGN